MKRGKFNITGAAITEYALVLGVVSFALLSMNVYISRGLQGKVRDITNYFISNQQIGEINPTSISNSTTVTSSPLVNLNTTLLPGGSSSLVYSDTTTTTVVGDSIDQDLPVKDGVFVPAEAGTTVAPLPES